MDLSTDPSIDALLAMLRTMTNSSNSKDVLADFMGQYGRVRPIDAYVGLVSDPSAPDAYRITYAVSLKDAVNGRINHTRDMRPEAVARLPIRRGGVFADLMRDARPKMVFDLSPIDDPVAGPVVAGLKSCMALPIYRGDEVFEWTFAFSNVPEGLLQPRDVGQAAMTANLLGAANRNIDMVAEINRLNEVLRGQIDGIARVQQSLLPATLPDIPRVRIATSYLTSDAAGGDYFDFFPLPFGRWGILIADVSGHGPAAATVMAMLHAILHCYEPPGHTAGATEPPGHSHWVDPAAVMCYANRRLYAAGLEGSFITAFFAVLDPITGEVRYCNCGHNPPRRKIGMSGGVDEIREGATLPLGIVEELPDAQSVTLHLQPTDTLVLYTDGITEAFDELGEMFGEHRLDEALHSCSGDPDCIVQSIHTNLFAHRKTRTRDDDQTIVAVRYVGG